MERRVRVSACRWNLVASGIGKSGGKWQYQVVVNCMEELLRVLISFHFIYLFEKKKKINQTKKTKSLKTID